MIAHAKRDIDRTKIAVLDHAPCASARSHIIRNDFVMSARRVDLRAMRSSMRQDWIAAAAVLAALVVTFAIPAATTGASLARAVAAIAIGALIALAVARSPFTFAVRVRSGFVLLVALALWYVLTRLWAVDPAGSMFESARVSAFVLLAWAVHTCVVGTAARRVLLAGLALAALYVCADPLWDTLTDGAPTVRVSGALDYWNATACVALVLVPTAVALAGSGRRRLIVLASALIPIAGVCAVASASRGALVALFVALLVQALLDPDYRGGLPRALVAAGSLLLVIVGLAIDGMPVAISLLGPMLVAIGGFGLIRARRVRRERVILTAVPTVADPDAADLDSTDTPPADLRSRFRIGGRAVGALIVALLVVLLIALVLDANNNDLPTTAPGSSPSASHSSDVERLASTDDSVRFEWWREGIKMWTDRPIIGLGGGAFGALHVVAAGANLGHVHSMPLEVLIETGLVGALLLLAGTILLLRVLRQGHRTPERALAGAICALVLVQACLDWTLSLPQVLILLAIAGPIALVNPPDPDDETAATAPAQVPTWAALTMLAALAAATTVALTPMLATLLADQAARKFDQGKMHSAAELSAQSLLLVPALDTLTIQVAALQRSGDDAAARDTLRDHQQVWLHSLDGLGLAQQLLHDDPELGPDIARRITTIENRQAAAIATAPPDTNR